MKLIRIGTCNGCGDCCKPETIPARIEAYEKAEVPYRIVNMETPEGCSKFDKATGKCKDYENRPEICRTFPNHPADIAALPRCGYRFEYFSDKQLECHNCKSIVEIELVENCKCNCGAKEHYKKVCKKCGFTSYIHRRKIACIQPEPEPNYQGIGG